MVPEGRGVFTRMTITENLQMGAHIRNDKGHRSGHGQGVRYLPAPEGAPRPAGWHHVGGEQQMLAMGRALMSRPKVLLLDEPSMGLSPIMVDKIFEGARRFRPGRDHPAGGAERQPRPEHHQPRLRDGVRRNHHDR